MKRTIIGWSATLAVILLASPAATVAAPTLQPTPTDTINSIKTAIDNLPPPPTTTTTTTSPTSATTAIKPTDTTATTTTTGPLYDLLEMGEQRAPTEQRASTPGPSPTTTTTTTPVAEPTLTCPSTKPRVRRVVGTTNVYHCI